MILDSRLRGNDVIGSDFDVALVKALDRLEISNTICQNVAC